MEYHEAAEFLVGLRRFRPTPGTASTARLLAHLGDPHETVDCVQIAGSNGKGSTARFLERTLREAGLSVGLYTSPHLSDLRERIRVDGRKIPRAAIIEFVESVQPYVTAQGADGEAPTFFEAMTALAIWHVAREGCDICVLEVGIGGKYDATSVVDPVASAVTSVTLEHTGIIGETEVEIAHDKAHVAPEDAPLVTAVTGEPLDAIRAVADSVVTVGEQDRDGPAPDVRVAYGGPTNHTEAAVTIDGDDWTVDTQVPLLGAHQATNAGIAATLARQLTDLSQRDLERGLRAAHWPGRFEVMAPEPLVVLDGAHNPGACERLAETLASYEYDDCHLVIGAMHDKSHREMASALPDPTSVVATDPGLERAEDPAVIASVYEDRNVGSVDTVGSVEAALTMALERANDDDCVLVTGSLFVVAEARERWVGRSVPKRVRDRTDAARALERATVPTTTADRVTDAAIHRVVETNLTQSQATVLQAAVARAGGEVALAGHRHGDERVDVVCMATRSQYETVANRLTDRGHGLEAVTADLLETVERTIDAPASDGATRFPWHDRPAVMGILNVTPDSFHDGGEYDALTDAVSRAEAMVEAGADVIDVGGESTRPGADPVPVGEEIDRVVPVIEQIADLEATISVDTRKAAVAEAALEAGADVINDVSGLEDPEMRFVAADNDAGLIIMHSIDAPVVPDREVTYDDVVGDTIEELGERLLLAEKAGLERDQLVVDPGLGFGKTATESFELLGRLGEFQALECPILVGHSHKSMFGHVGQSAGERLPSTVAASALAVDRGADIVRVHDVPENVAAVRTALTARDPSHEAW